MSEDKQSKKLRCLADQLLERLAQQVENNELDYSAIKQICATMKDLKDITQRQSSQSGGGVTVVLGKELEEMSE